MRIALQPSYLLHARKISDSRLLVDFFTRDYGIVGAIARAPSKKKSAFSLFRPALISWLGNSPLKTLTDHELAQSTLTPLNGQSLYCGFYLNELLQRLMPKGEASDKLYECYCHCIEQLSRSAEAEPLLRSFEFLLLEELGYAVDFVCDCHSGEKIDPAAVYVVDAGQGFSRTMLRHATTFDGVDIIAIAKNDYSTQEAKRAAKILSRLLLKPLLGAKPLKSRELFLAEF